MIKIRPTDALFSKIIRTKAGWRCERCGNQFTPPTSGLHCSHYWGRARENTRFDEKNCSSICYGCHSYFHAHPEEHREWMIKKLGRKEFDKLKVRAQLTKKKDDKLTMIYLKQLEKQYENPREDSLNF